MTSGIGIPPPGSLVEQMKMRGGEVEWDQSACDWLPSQLEEYSWCGSKESGGQLGRWTEIALHRVIVGIPLSLWVSVQLAEPAQALIFYLMWTWSTLRPIFRVLWYVMGRVWVSPAQAVFQIMMACPVQWAVLGHIRNTSYLHCTSQDSYRFVKSIHSKLDTFNSWKL